jgi:hypothetical protein
MRMQAYTPLPIYFLGGLLICLEMDFLLVRLFFFEEIAVHSSLFLLIVSYQMKRPHTIHRGPLSFTSCNLDPLLSPVSQSASPLNHSFMR